MKFKVSEYKAIKETVLKIYNERPDRLEELCVASSIPLIAAYWFLKDKDDKFQNKINDLAEFYNYEVEY